MKRKQFGDFLLMILNEILIGNMSRTGLEHMSQYFRSAAQNHRFEYCPKQFCNLNLA